MMETLHTLPVKQQASVLLIGNGADIELLWSSKAEINDVFKREERKKQSAHSAWEITLIAVP